MSLLRTTRMLPALAVALVALFAVASTGLAAAAAGHHSTAVAAKKKKKKKAAPKGPFQARDATATAIHPGPDTTTIEQLTVPAGTWAVTAKAELGNNAATANSVSCQLLQANNPIDSGTEDLSPQATFSRTITLTGTATGGPLKLVCSADKGAQARNRVIIAR